ncbi:MAG: PEP-CTERM/exosortase system-associated acyltransferase [Thiohalocapsa sp. PB-PSB1]|jgi:N-acyl amino acid synthase of PEP-CTERM/exosortase system|nr:MAG: hypothetical protein N838_32750 [Thiohalocapsa sp. PB-PSB1]QQO57015.1 MAG: PEP-CTERM/exosortase system-associated acyltransferase [Thiohalocapsa sp. PB-PSB1]
MFINRFETVLADSSAAREVHYRVRYRVFCEEARFENAANFPDQMERDSFDSHAVHFIVWDRLEREWVGAMRLVFASDRTLPCEVICASDLKDLNERRSRAVEFSRLCVLAKYRKTEQAYKWGALLTDRLSGAGRETSIFFRQEENEIFLRLLGASFVWGQENDVDHLYFIINRATTRLLTRFGIPLEIVGDPVEHRGLRTPQSCNVREAEAGMRKTLPGFERMLNNGPAFVAYSTFIGDPIPIPQNTTNVLQFPKDAIAENRHPAIPTAAACQPLSATL